MADDTLGIFAAIRGALASSRVSRLVAERRAARFIVEVEIAEHLPGGVPDDERLRVPINCPR